MPRLTHLHPSYRLQKQSGQVIVTLSGKDFYLGPHSSEKSRAEYDRLLGEWLDNGRCWPQEPVPEPDAPYSIIRLWARQPSS